jgi:hypothetical protein
VVFEIAVPLDERYMDRKISMSSIKARISVLLWVLGPMCVCGEDCSRWHATQCLADDGLKELPNRFAVLVGWFNYMSVVARSFMTEILHRVIVPTYKSLVRGSPSA